MRREPSWPSRPFSLMRRPLPVLEVKPESIPAYVLQGVTEPRRGSIPGSVLGSVPVPHSQRGGCGKNRGGGVANQLSIFTRRYWCF